MMVFAQDEVAQHLSSFFLMSITHEFRTPLSAMNASVEFLLGEFDLLSKDEVMDLLKSIHLSVTGLQTLIDNLLESIDIEAGRFGINPKPVNLADAVTESLCVMQPLLDRRQQQVSVRELDDIPLLYGDLTYLTQVLVNLLSNASKYGPIEGAIDVSLERSGRDKVRVTVADRGPGVPKAERGNIFCRFYRLDTRDGAQYGLGLGLSVVKAIIQEHGGEVGVDERPGGGSIFWFTVPVVGGSV